MPIRLVALDEGPDIPLDRAMVVVGRHPQCDARLDSIRVSRRHCCMMQERESGDVIVRDLGSTNGIRINGQRVEMGKLRPGDELSIAHIRFRFELGQENDQTLAETVRGDREGAGLAHYPQSPAIASVKEVGENALAAAVRDLLPSALADQCRIQVIVQLPSEKTPTDSVSQNHAIPSAGAMQPLSSVDAPESDEPCPPDSSH